MQTLKERQKQRVLEEVRKYSTAEEFLEVIEDKKRRREYDISSNKLADKFFINFEEVSMPADAKPANVGILINDRSALLFQTSDRFGDVKKAFKSEDGSIFGFLKKGIDLEKVLKKMTKTVMWEFQNRKDIPYLKGLGVRCLTNDDGKTWFCFEPFNLLEEFEKLSESEKKEMLKF